MIQKRIAVMVYGPPGSGKGTQANLLADKLGLIHFDTGRFLESVVHDPSRQKEKVIQRERKNFDEGRLTTPSFALREVRREAAKIAKAGWGLVFSGSPRTVFETERLVPILEKLYGKKRLFFFVLDVPPQTSVARNSKRMLCSFCGATLLTAYYPSSHPKYCPICGGKLYRRTVDHASIIKIRIKEYQERTEPIFALLRQWGYRPEKISGAPSPHKVFQKINALIERRPLR